MGLTYDPYRSKRGEKRVANRNEKKRKEPKINKDDVLARTRAALKQVMNR